MLVNQHGISKQISINLGKTSLRISRIRNILLSWNLTRVFVYLPLFFSRIPDFIYWMVLIFILIYCEWRDTENQQLSKTGPIIDPWGTPASFLPGWVNIPKLNSEEDKGGSLLWAYLISVLSVFSSAPYWRSLDTIKSCGRVSNALHKSMETRLMIFWLSSSFFHRLVSVSKAALFDFYVDIQYLIMEVKVRITGMWPPCFERKLTIISGIVKLYRWFRIEFKRLQCKKYNWSCILSNMLWAPFHTCCIKFMKVHQFAFVQNCSSLTSTALPSPSLNIQFTLSGGKVNMLTVPYHTGSTFCKLPI